MIIYTSKDSFLEIPKGLGNLGGNSGGGSGEDLGPLSGSVVELSAVTESEAVKLADLSASTENLASSVGAMATDLEAVSGSVETLTDTVDSQGDSIADLLLDVDALDGRVSGNTSDIEALSAQTSANTADIAALSSATENVSQTVESVSAQTTANTANIETLSATTEDIYNEVFYEEEGERYSYIGDLQDAVDEKQDVLEAGDGISLDSPTISVKAGKGLYFKEDGRMEVLPGNGLTFSGNSNALSVKIGDGLAFSGGTLVVSGGSGNGPRVIFLNKLTEQERIALYNELASKYDYNANGWTSAYTEDEYAFYIDLRDYQDQQTYQTGDHYEGFFPMQLERMHPSDYGGAAFFGGVEADRVGNGNLIQIRFVITYEGGYENGTWWNSPSSDPTMQYNFRINSDGTIANDQDWSYIADSNNASRAVMQYFEGTQYGDIYSEGKVKWVNMYPTTYNGETKWYWIWAADICIGTTMYSGVWGMLQDQWYTGSDVPPQVLQWTSGATYESQTYPSII